jgi:hypothetical protein
LFVEVLGSVNGAVKDGRWGVDIARVSDGYLPLGGRREFDMQGSHKPVVSSRRGHQHGLGGLLEGCGPPPVR